MLKFVLSTTTMCGRSIHIRKEITLQETPMRLPVVFAIFYHCYLLAVLGFELRALGLLGKHAWAMPPVLSAMGYFSDRFSHFSPGQSWIVNLLFIPPHIDYPLRWSLITFCLGWPQTAILPVSTSQRSWDYRYEPPCPPLQYFIY
jgi:hypothetical protein